MAPSLSGATCSSNKAAAASSVSKRSHSQKLQHKQENNQLNAVQSASQRQQRRLNTQRAADLKARGGGDFKHTAGTASCAQGSGGTWKPRRETIKRLTIKAWVAPKLITASVVCYQLQRDALMTSWGGKKLNGNNKSLSTLQHVSAIIQISINSDEKMSAVATFSSQNAEHRNLYGCLSPPTRQHNKCCSQQMQNCLAGRFIPGFFFSFSSSRQATKTVFQKGKEKQQQQQKANLSLINPCGAVKGGVMNWNNVICYLVNLQNEHCRKTMQIICGGNVDKDLPCCDGSSAL